MVAKEIINHFQLLEHPEGGFYKETYRSSIVANSVSLNNEFEGDRNL